MNATRVAVVIAALFGLATGTASAQTFAPVATPDPADPALSYNHPRLYRLLEVLSEPQVLRNPSPYPGYVPTRHPFLEAAPNFANLVFMGLAGINSTPLAVASFLAPIGIRAVRVALYGTPFTMSRREVALWVVSPALVHMRRNYESTGHFLKNPVFKRAGGTVFPRLHARLFGQGRAGPCDCR
jgi:hypothetical protein